MSKKQFLGLMASIPVIAYLIFAFIGWEFSFYEWGPAFRIIYVLFVGITWFGIGEHARLFKWVK